MEKEVFCYLIKIVTTTNNEIVVKHIVKKIVEIISEKDFYPKELEKYIVNMCLNQKRFSCGVLLILLKKLSMHYCCLAFLS